MTNSDSNGGTGAIKKPKNRFPAQPLGQGPGVRGQGSGLVGRFQIRPTTLFGPISPHSPGLSLARSFPRTTPARPRWGAGKRQSDSPNYQISKSPNPSFPRTARGPADSWPPTWPPTLTPTLFRTPTPNP